MRFGTRVLLLTVTVVCLLCTCYVIARKVYYSERNANRKALANVEGISSVAINGFEDVVGEISFTSFSVDDCPGSVVRTSSLNSYEKDGKFFLSRIGKWQFRVHGRRHCGVWKIETSEPVESNYYGYSIEIGPESPYRDLIPFNAGSLQGLVDNYEQFDELLATWPRETDPGQVTLEDGSIQYYYVEHVPDAEK